MAWHAFFISHVKKQPSQSHKSETEQKKTPQAAEVCKYTFAF